MPAWLVFIFTRHGSTDLKTSESLVVKWRILLHGENLFKWESCVNGSCLRVPLKAVAYGSLLPFLYFNVWLEVSLITQNTMWNFCSLARQILTRFQWQTLLSYIEVYCIYKAPLMEMKKKKNKPPHLWVSFLKYCCKISDVKQWDTNYPVNR